MPFADRIEHVGYDDLDGHSCFKLALHDTGERIYLYVAALWEPGLSIVEVTDPARARYVRWVPGPPGTWTLQVQVADGLMVTNMERIPAGWGEPSPDFQEGFVVWSLDDPEDPKELGRWHSGGLGTHRNFFAGGRFVHTAAWPAGFDGHIYVIVDIEDPTDPRAVGRWWWPGQHVEGGETYSIADVAKLTSGKPTPRIVPCSLHAGPYVEGDRAYAAWMRAGFVLLDIADPTQPELVSALPVYPPLGSSIAMHTAVPLRDRNLVVINSEALHERCQEPVSFAGIVDVSEERDPVLISLFPTPVLPDGYPASSFCKKGGRFGPHNQHQPQGQDSLEPIGDYVYLTYFNAGLQVYDISDPRAPQIAGYYIPDDPQRRRGPLPSELVAQVEDVIVDRRGYAYITEKNSGVTILRFDATRGD